MQPENLPAFKNETEEAAYWDSHDSTEVIDWGKAKKVRFPNVLKSARKIAASAKAEYEELEGTIDDGL